MLIIFTRTNFILKKERKGGGGRALSALVAGRLGQARGPGHAGTTAGQCLVLHRGAGSLLEETLGSGVLLGQVLLMHIFRRGPLAQT